MRRAVLWSGCLLAAASVLALGLGPLGTRAGWWSFRGGFALLRWSVYLGVAAAALSCAGGLLTRRWLPATAAMVIGLAAAAVPWQLMRSARGVPAIHDITTDPDNPPAFVAILPLRKDAANPPQYAGPEAAGQQRRAYPDIQPLLLDLPPAEAFDLALQAARDMEWEIVAAERKDGRIEAVDTTFWFGFKDDVVIRVSGSAGGSRVDVRSKSRVGRGDAGANARRIGEFLQRLRNIR